MNTFESTNYNITHILAVTTKNPQTSDHINICIHFHKLSGIFSEHSQDTLGPYILDKESWAMVPLFSHIMNIGSAQWGQIILEGVFLLTSFFTRRKIYISSTFDTNVS